MDERRSGRGGGSDSGPVTALRPPRESREGASAALGAQPAQGGDPRLGARSVRPAPARQYDGASPPSGLRPSRCADGAAGRRRPDRDGGQQDGLSHGNSSSLRRSQRFGLFNTAAAAPAATTQTPQLHVLRARPMDACSTASLPHWSRVPLVRGGPERGAANSLAARAVRQVLAFCSKQFPIFHEMTHLLFLLTYFI